MLEVKVQSYHAGLVSYLNTSLWYFLVNQGLWQ